MTFRQFFHQKLVSNLLWEKEADAVLDKIEAEDDSMKGRWHDAISGYPDTLLVVLWMNVKLVAIDHLKATAPKHIALNVLQGG